MACHKVCKQGVDNWSEHSEPHTCGENGKLSIYLYIYIYIYGMCVFYIYILPHLCIMQYFHIATTVAQETRLAGQKG